jgi:hypothetical protein
LYSPAGMLCSSSSMGYAGHRSLLHIGKSHK